MNGLNGSASDNSRILSMVILETRTPLAHARQVCKVCVFPARQDGGRTERAGWFQPWHAFIGETGVRQAEFLQMRQVLYSGESAPVDRPVRDEEHAQPGQALSPLPWCRIPRPLKSFR